MEFDILLALHFVGLLIGAGGGIDSAIVMAQARRMSSEDAGVVRRVGPVMGLVSLMGVLLMPATGVGMLLVKYQGQFGTMPILFHWKMLFVVTLTIATVVIELTYASLKKGNVAAAARLPRIGPIAGISAMLATVPAAFAFH
ncbi:MAG: hypothetical protein ABL956_11220 [Hyphomonadaceae bacterium]